MTAFKRVGEKKGTPFVEVDPSVCDYVRDHGDSCVQEMFSRYVKDDGNVTAVFPFQRLEHSFFVTSDLLGNRFDPEKERQSNQNLRSLIKEMKEGVTSFVDRSNPQAVSKTEHYIAALDTHLQVCKGTDEIITMFTSPSRPRRRK